MKPISSSLQLSKGIYGRDKQLADLLRAFHWTALGATEFALVTGPSGIGKSSFVMEVFRPQVSGKCYFAWGKLDPYNPSQPYEAIIKCFRFLIRQLLTEPESSLKQWKARLSEAVGSNGSVIVELIPEARLLLEGSARYEKLTAKETLNRFELVFRRFVRTFTRSRYPLVLFIDDIHRADRATLSLVQSLLQDSEIQHLLIIGACRNREWHQNEDIYEQWIGDPDNKASVLQFEILPLELEHVQAVTAETLQCSYDNCEELARALFAKSIGNPFYLKQLLQAAYDDRIIRCDSDGNWQWEVEELYRYPSNDEQIDYLIERINRLPEDSRKMLVYAACLGGKFGTSELSAISGFDENLLDRRLWLAVQNGLLSKIIGVKEERVYVFIHDRIHQAAYSLLDKRERERIHLDGALHMLRRDQSADLERDCFEIANHLNQAEELLNEELRDKSVRANVLAGRKAMQSSAYEIALHYLEQAIHLIPAHYWEHHYDFVFRLYLNAAECAYLCSRYELAEQRLDYARSRATSWEHRAQVVKLKLDQYSNTGKYKQAIALGVATLREGGIRIADNPSRLKVKTEIAKTRIMLNRKLNGLSSLRETDNEQVRLVAELFVSLVGPTFFSDRTVFALLASKLIRWFERYGAPPAAPAVYSSFGMVLITMTGDLQGGYRLGEAAMELADRSGSPSLRAKVYTMFYCVISPWMKSDPTGEEKLREAIRLAMESGNYVYGSYATGGLINQSYARLPMKRMHMVMRECLQWDELMREELIRTNVLIYKHLAEKLQSGDCHQLTITDGRESEKEFLDEVRHHESSAVTLYQYYTYKTQTYYLFEQFEKAAECAEWAEPFEQLSVQSPHLPIHHFYEALAIAALLRKASAAHQRTWRRRLKRRCRQFKRWAGMSPSMFYHKYLLLKAEAARLTEADSNITDWYEQSIREARIQGDFQCVAVACECAGNYHASKGRERMARGYVQEAYEAYGDWGVEAKRSAIRAGYPEWFQGRKGQEAQKSLSDESTRQAELQQRKGMGSDLLRIVKNSLVLSGNMDFLDIRNRLGESLMTAGEANYGCLISRREDGLWVEQAMVNNRPGALLRERLEDSEAAPAMMVQYVSRMGQELHLTDAIQDELFRHDPYIIKHGTSSASCLPIYVHDRLEGVLYLEIPLQAYPLPDALVEMLAILSAQTLFVLRLSDTFDDQAEVSSSSEEEAAQPVIDPLTERELEVLNWMAAGLANKEIAIQLGVAAGTVKVHIHNIFGKLNVNRRTKAIAEAVKLNLLDKPTGGKSGG